MEKPIKVNSLQLPAYLVELIHLNKWSAFREQSKLFSLIEMPYANRFNFMGTDSMERETMAGRRISRDEVQSRIYCVQSSKLLERQIIESDILDIDLAVFIAINTDEDVISLDYRSNLEEPTVCSFLDEGQKRGWKIIAPDFTTFARLIGL
jgi:hypothetical protein